MSNSAIKAFLTVVSLSTFALLGCSSSEVKTQSENGATDLAEKPVDVVVNSPANKDIAAENSVVSESAVPPVETIPAKDIDTTAIAVESMPAAPVASKKPVVEKVEVVPAPVVVTKSAKAGPMHHVITLVKKDASHPAYGKGHAMGFSLDGVPGKSIVIERGKTYTFDIQTNPKHDVYLSSKEIGWGSASVVEGVEGAYISKGEMSFTPGKKSPSKVYYACRNHPYMGGALYVVNPGEKVEIETVTASTTAAPAKKAAVSENKVKQKIMFADMMVNGQGAKRVAASSNVEAQQLIAGAKSDLAESRKKLLAGALPEALALADNALKRVGSASRLVPSEDAKAQLARRNDELQQEIKDFELSYERNYKRMAKAGNVSADVEYDKARVESLKSDAELLAGKGDYVKSNAKLEEAQSIVTMGLHKMLDSKTLVYDLKFESPAEEFEYELKRFSGYEALVPVAIEMKKPAAGALSLMDSFLEKARKRRDEAQGKADSGDYAAAMEMMVQATKTVRRALRMVGVSQ